MLQQAPLGKGYVPEQTITAPIVDRTHYTDESLRLACFAQSKATRDGEVAPFVDGAV